MTLRRSLSYTATGVALFAAASLVLAQAPAPAPAPSAAKAGPVTLNTATGQRIKVTLVADGLAHPYSIAFPDERTILVSEQTGRLRVIRDGSLLPTPVWETPPVPAGSTGNVNDNLHFIALHPGFAQNRLVYLSYQKHGPRGSTMALGRGTLKGDTLTDFKELFVAEAWEKSGANPGRIFFLRDGTILMTVGDRDGFCCNGSENTSQRMKAQTLDNDFGKILRLRDDGSIPPDNPFVGRAGALPQIYAYGTRNAYGLAYHPVTGELWESEIGPLGGDEINILKAGHNYGWPLASPGKNYTGSPIPWSQPGMDDPRMFWVPSISPSGLMFYTGDKFKGWKNSAFLGALNGKALWRVSFDNPKPQQNEQRETLLTTFDDRIRDVQQGPDGNLYVATEKTSGGRAVNGTLLRIEPAP
jgi:glucose/arabinose dehydrogenase